MAYHERNLPHWQPEGAALFVTWRLHGSMPSPDWGSRRDADSYFRDMDRSLDNSNSGPRWLTDSRIAKCVVDALHFGEDKLKLYTLTAYVVMPNHVHLLIEPKAELSKITRSVKGFTAREANKVLHLTGKPLWQQESFDHWVRNETEFTTVIRYIENNPVSAGLVERIEDHPWSSAYSQ